MIKENLENLLKDIPKTNKFGEIITLVGATKTQTVEAINEAIAAGLTDIGENRAQEFRDKFPQVLPCNYHFFGRLQTNKVKYLIGKACLIQSVDSLELAKKISSLSEQNNVTTNVLIEVNLGETQKGGVPIDEVFNLYNDILNLSNVITKGLMCVLPKTDEKSLRQNCLQMRNIYDILRSKDVNVNILSMGMSGDYKIAIEEGSNMIRIGTAIFGSRS